MRSIIIEDQPPLVTQLKRLLARTCPQVEIIGVAHNAIDGIHLIRDLHPELVFLDIQLPKISGFDMLAKLGNWDFEIIFVTGHDHYGIQAVKVSALDYLMKPVRGTDLKVAVQKAITKKAKHQTPAQIENLLSFIRHSGVTGHRIAIPLHKEVRFVNPDEIIRCEASNNYTTIFLSTKEKLLVAKGLYEYEELLTPYGFIRSHQSHLVNRKHIKSLTRELNINELLLSDGNKALVSKGQLPVVKKSMAENY